ncbi:catalase family protein [Chryseobacterium oryzae]|uniref:Catalase n=1 Tax=Chryseobacterium oryzae TaxID=2929799 RepID=A0ABY4BQB7_9FLAO|nr:catalase [Chryseobacterium oryzae]UOE38785.1 catalase [Chryseobacterium oryzae]
MSEPLSYSKNYDKLSYNEIQILEKAKKSISDFVENSALLSDVEYATRNVHAKTYAVLKGELIINKDLDENVRKIFGDEKYTVTARLSHASPKISNQKNVFPAYGFAFKIKNEQDKTIANYPLVNFPLLPVNSPIRLLKILIAMNHYQIKGWTRILPLLKQIGCNIPAILRFSFFKNCWNLLLKRKDFILSSDFYSVGAYRFDDKMIKIKISPVSVPKKFEQEISVKESLEKFFVSNEYVAEVLVQFCYDLKNQPIDKLHREWKNSPYLKLGVIKFNKNSILNPKSCENELLSFNPFESAEILQPVGKIQQLRNEAYKTSLQARKKINKLLKYQ